MDPDLTTAARTGNINDLYAIIQSKPNILDGRKKELFVETPLHVAASTGQTHFALEILRLKPSFGKKLNPEGLSPLHLALQNKHYETVRRLVKFDNELIRVKGKEGLTPLHFVAKTDDQVDLLSIKKKVHLLSEFLRVCPSSINDVTIHEETALHIAVKSSSLEAVAALLEWLRKTFKGEVLCLTDEGGNTVLHTAVSTSQPEIVKLLVNETYTDKNAKNLEGHTALEIAETLPDGPAKTDIDKTLRDAEASKRSPIVSDLGEFLKPDILGKELFVETPLHVAASAGETYLALEILRLQPSFGEKLNPEGLSPLHLALENKHSETVRRLVKFNSELIRVKGREGLTPLHFVAKTDDQDNLLSEFLDVCPSSINDVTIHEETALHIAVKNSSLKAVKVLLEWLQKTYKGEVLWLKDEGGNTVLHTAVSTSQPEIVKLLVNETYTDKNAKNLDGHTALEIAAKLPNGQAKTNIEETLPHAGTLRLGEFLKSPRQWFQALIGRIIYEQREMSIDMRNTILVVAVLIATSTFQAVLQPPGGVMRGNYTPSPASNTTGNINGTITTTNFISTNITHFNATIFNDNNNTDTDANPDNPAEIKLTKSMTFGSFFLDFFTLNTVCFLASITAMIFVLPLRLSSFMLHISLLFLIVSYGIAFYGISPTPTYANSFFLASYIAFPCAYSMWITISIISLFPKIRQYRSGPHELWKRLQMLRDLYKKAVDMSPKIPIQQSQI